ncbi:MAG: hypothetical protein IJ678_03325, partial [Kiritimatiellae bacterium]|nr:hypothetical protein [Kiritimatiellia bacterium]
MKRILRFLHAAALAPLAVSAAVEAHWTSPSNAVFSFDVAPGSEIRVDYVVCEPGRCLPPGTVELLPQDSAAEQQPAAPAAADSGVESRIPPAGDWLDGAVVERVCAGYAGPERYAKFLRGEADASRDPLGRARGGVLALVLALFLGGELLHLSQCVLPLVPVNVALLGAC